MHISEGVLSAPVLVSGAALALAGVAVGLRKLENERLVTTAVLAAAFFVASLVHVPLGPGNVHLVLSGLLGLLLGWAAFPAIFVALLLQAILFQYGGLTILGLNTFNMAFPAVLCSGLFAWLLNKSRGWRTVGAFCCGAFSVAGAALLTSLSLAFSEEGFLVSAQLLFAAHIPVIILEGLMTALIISFICKVRPEIFLKPSLPPGCPESKHALS